MSLTNDQLEALIDSLTARVNSLDGVGLPSGVVSTVAALQAVDQGTTRDLKQSLLVLQQQLSTLITQVANLQTLVNTKLGS